MTLSRNPHRQCGTLGIRFRYEPRSKSASVNVNAKFQSKNLQALTLTLFFNDRISLKTARTGPTVLLQRDFRGTKVNPGWHSKPLVIRMLFDFRAFLASQRKLGVTLAASNAPCLRDLTRIVVPGRTP